MQTVAESAIPLDGPRFVHALGRLTCQILVRVHRLGNIATQVAIPRGGRQSRDTAADAPGPAVPVLPR